MNDYQTANMNSFDFDNSYTGDNGINYNDIDINVTEDTNNIGNIGSGMTSGGCCSSPITECPQERCIHRTIMHEVPQG